MGRVFSSLRRRAGFGVFVAGIALALMVPVAALAANTATFSSATPKNGSWSTQTRPKVSVVVYDRYGAKLSGVSMTIDGNKVSPSLTYIVSGSWNPSSPDRRKFKLSYSVTNALRVGTHTVTVKVKDLKSRYSTYTWKFKVESTAPPAEFSSYTPEKDSSSTTSLPLIAVSTYDPYGVKGTGSYSMKIDGVKVPATIKYTTTGDYKRFKVSYRPEAPLAPGTHTVSVAVEDLHDHDSSTSWSFIVLAPDPVYESMPVAGTECGDCHTSYPAAHPMNQCQLCHGEGRPAGAPEYTPADQSAHTMSCSLESPCHGGGGAFPHVLGSDCISCHNASHPEMPAVHSRSIDSYHAVGASFCTTKGCHVASLTTEHYRHTVDGARLSCESCHASTEAAVVAAIDAGATDCQSCHVFGDGQHPGTTTAHTAIGTCVRAGCHATNVSDIHDGNCAACHAPDKTPSTLCTTCHSADAYHPDEAAAHAVPAGGCIANGCHGTATGGDAILIHKRICARCHTGSGTPTLVCATCHTGDTLSFHPEQAVEHAAAVVSCTTADCHGTDVTTIHVVDGDRRCVACHDGTKTPSTVCADCHDADLRIVHADAAESHTVASGGACAQTDCHDLDVTKIHDIESGGPGCGACHDPGVTPSLECGTCHAGDLAVIHAAAGANHSAPTVSCVSENCHDLDVTEIHKVDGVYKCIACHHEGTTPTALCTTCHVGDLPQLHSSADAAHQAPAEMCVTVCHGTTVTEIHQADGEFKCSACHNDDVAPSTTCATCHTGTVGQAHAWAGGFHTAPAGACVLSGCHGSDLIDLHDAATGQGCPACHAEGKNPSANCASCHAGDVLSVHSSADAAHASPTGITCIAPVCHETNVAAIHNHVEGPGCSACHAPGKTPSTDCSTCHTGAVEVTHTQVAAHTVTLPGCVTSTCHVSGNAATLHQSTALSCTNCHKPSSPATILCGSCHPTDDIMSIHSSATAAHTAPAGSCIQTDCHGENAAVLHQRGPGCGACHSGSATPTLTCTACHSGDVNVVHAGAAVAHVARAGYCVRSGCHGGDLTSIHSTGPGCKACHAAGKTASSTCTDCHAATQIEVHAASDGLHTVPQGTCAGYGSGSSCHHTRVDTVHSAAPNRCRSCHTTGVTPSTTCANCHVGADAPAHATATTLHAAPGGLCVNSQCHKVDVSAIHKDSGSSCLACHGPEASASLTCANCHTDDVFVTHTGGDSAHAAPAGTCVTSKCHGSDVRTLHDAAGGPGCAACHGENVTASLTCTDCHTTGFETLHARGTGSHTSPAGSCVRAYCHVGDVVGLHAPGPNCSACHAAGKTPSVTCGDCHTGTSVSVHTPYIGTKHDVAFAACTAAGCHSASAAAIHSVPGGPSCRPCHTDGPLTLTCDSSGCHSGDVTTYTAHAAEDAAHTVTGVTCVKSGCHLSNVAKLHVGSDSNCAACHTGGIAVKTCSNCHGGFTPAHPAPAAKHTAPTGTCVKSGCHGTDVAALHNLAPTQCDSCHGEGKTPSLTCSTCHGAGGFPPNHPAPVAKHAITGNGCVSSACHASANGATIHDAAPTKCDACHGAGKTPSLVCTTCHTASVQVLHPTAAGVHGVGNSCTGGSCHKTDVSLIHVKGGVNKCGACHATGVTATTNCSTCHTGGADHTAQHGSCNGCHGGDHWGGPYVGTGECSSCHGQGGSYTHPGTGCHGCNDPGGYTWTGIW